MLYSTMVKRNNNKNDCSNYREKYYLNSWTTRIAINLVQQVFASTASCGIYWSINKGMSFEVSGLIRLGLNQKKKKL